MAASQSLVIDGNNYEFGIEITQDGGKPAVNLIDLSTEQNINPRLVPHLPTIIEQLTSQHFPDLQPSDVNWNLSGDSYQSPIEINVAEGRVLATTLADGLRYDTQNGLMLTAPEQPYIVLSPHFGDDQALRGWLSSLSPEEKVNVAESFGPQQDRILANIEFDPETLRAVMTRTSGMGVTFDLSQYEPAQDHIYSKTGPDNSGLTSEDSEVYAPNRQLRASITDTLEMMPELTGQSWADLSSNPNTAAATAAAIAIAPPGTLPDPSLTVRMDAESYALFREHISFVQPPDDIGHTNYRLQNIQEALLTGSIDHLPPEISEHDRYRLTVATAELEPMSAAGIRSQIDAVRSGMATGLPAALYNYHDQRATQLRDMLAQNQGQEWLQRYQESRANWDTLSFDQKIEFANLHTAVMGEVYEINAPPVVPEYIADPMERGAFYSTLNRLDGEIRLNSNLEGALARDNFTGVLSTVSHEFGHAEAKRLGLGVSIYGRALLNEADQAHVNIIDPSSPLYEPATLLSYNQFDTQRSGFYISPEVDTDRYARQIEEVNARQVGHAFSTTVDNMLSAMSQVSTVPGQVDLVNALDNDITSVLALNPNAMQDVPIDRIRDYRIAFNNFNEAASTNANVELRLVEFCEAYKRLARPVLLDFDLDRNTQAQLLNSLDTVNNVSALQQAAITPDPGLIRDFVPTSRPTSPDPTLTDVKVGGVDTEGRAPRSYVEVSYDPAEEQSARRVDTPSAVDDVPTINSRMGMLAANADGGMRVSTGGIFGVMAAVNLHHSTQQSDTGGIVIASADVVVNAASLGVDTALLVQSIRAGSFAAPASSGLMTTSKILGPIGAGIAVIDGGYRIYREDGEFIENDHGSVLGERGLRASGVAVQTGVGLSAFAVSGTGVAAGGLGTTLAVAAAPVVIIGGTIILAGIATDRAIENHKIHQHVDGMIDEISAATRDTYTEVPNLANYRQFRTAMQDHSAQYLNDSDLVGHVERNDQGVITNARDIDWSHPDNMAALENMIDKALEDQEGIRYENSSALPDWIRLSKDVREELYAAAPVPNLPDHVIQERLHGDIAIEHEADMHIATLRGLQEEITMFVDELAFYEETQAELHDLQNQHMAAAEDMLNALVGAETDRERSEILRDYQKTEFDIYLAAGQLPETMEREQLRLETRLNTASTEIYLAKIAFSADSAEFHLERARSVMTDLGLDLSDDQSYAALGLTRAEFEAIPGQWQDSVLAARDEIQGRHDVATDNMTSALSEAQTDQDRMAVMREYVHVSRDVYSDAIYLPGSPERDQLMSEIKLDEVRGYVAVAQSFENPETAERYLGLVEMSMVDAGLDPNNPESYAALGLTKEELEGIPNQAQQRIEAALDEVNAQYEAVIEGLNHALANVEFDYEKNTIMLEHSSAMFDIRVNAEGSLPLCANDQRRANEHFYEAKAYIAAARAFDDPEIAARYLDRAQTAMAEAGIDPNSAESYVMFGLTPEEFDALVAPQDAGSETVASKAVEKHPSGNEKVIEVYDKGVEDLQYGGNALSGKFREEVVAEATMAELRDGGSTKLEPQTDTSEVALDTPQDDVDVPYNNNNLPTHS